MPPIKELTLASAIARLNRNHEDEAAQNFIRGLIGTKALLRAAGIELGKMNDANTPRSTVPVHLSLSSEL